MKERHAEESGYYTQILNLSQNRVWVNMAVVSALILGVIIGFVLGRLVAKPGQPLGAVIILSALCGLALGLLF